MGSGSECGLRVLRDVLVPLTGTRVGNAEDSVTGMFREVEAKTGIVTVAVGAVRSCGRGAAATTTVKPATQRRKRMLPERCSQ